MFGWTTWPKKNCTALLHCRPPSASRVTLGRDMGSLPSIRKNHFRPAATYSRAPRPASSKMLLDPQTATEQPLLFPDSVGDTGHGIDRIPPNFPDVALQVCLRPLGRGHHHEVLEMMGFGPLPPLSRSPRNHPTRFMLSI